MTFWSICFQKVPHFQMILRQTRRSINREKPRNWRIHRDTSRANMRRSIRFGHVQSSPRRIVPDRCTIARKPGRNCDACKLMLLEILIQEFEPLGAACVKVTRKLIYEIDIYCFQGVATANAPKFPVVGIATEYFIHYFCMTHSFLIQFFLFFIFTLTVLLANPKILATLIWFNPWLTMLTIANYISVSTFSDLCAFPWPALVLDAWSLSVFLLL